VILNDITYDISVDIIYLVPPPPFIAWWPCSTFQPHGWYLPICQGAGSTATSFGVGEDFFLGEFAHFWEESAMQKSVDFGINPAITL
jgi:hypothetical protein